MGMVEVQGLDNLLRRMDRADVVVRRAALNGIKKGALRIISDAKANLRQNGSVVTGLLRISGHVEPIDTRRQEVTFGFFDTQNRQDGYAAYVEFGRRAGKFPPIDIIRQWLRKKYGLADGRELDSRAFLTARSIAEHGTVPHPFFQPALDKNRGWVVRAIQEAINVSTREGAGL